MNGFDRLYKNISAFNLDKYLKEWFKNNEDFVTGLNKDRLNKFGTDVKDKKLITYGGAGANTGSYSTYTIEQKKKKGQPYKHVTLKDTGEFHDSFKVKIEGSGFAIEGDEDKPDGKISDNLEIEPALGLGMDDLEVLKELLIEDLRTDILTALTK